MEDQWQKVEYLDQSCEVVNWRSGKKQKNSYLVIDQAPLLEECVNSHNSTDVPGKIPPTCRYREILCRVQTVCVDHEVTIVFVDCWSFAPVPTVKELWQSLSLKLVDVVHVEPCTITR